MLYRKTKKKFRRNDDLPEFFLLNFPKTCPNNCPITQVPENDGLCIQVLQDRTDEQFSFSYKRVLQNKFIKSSRYDKKLFLVVINSVTGLFEW